MSSEELQKVDLMKDSKKLSTADRYFMSSFEEHNLKRVSRIKKFRKNSTIFGTVLGITALSIYAFTIHSVKQERFLDDLDEPETTTDII